jgi:integrase
VVALLNKLPEGQPFRRSDLKLESDKGSWRIQLQDLFERAKITEVKTDLEMRPAHPHQLRDTCAVWYIRKGALIQDVAKMLGDTVAKVTPQVALQVTRNVTRHVTRKVPTQVRSATNSRQSVGRTVGTLFN